MNHYFILFLFVLFRLLVPPMLPQPNSPHTHMSLITMDEENCNPERWRCTMELIAADTNTIVTLKTFLQPVCLFVPFLSISFAVFFFFYLLSLFLCFKEKGMPLASPMASLLHDIFKETRGNSFCPGDPTKKTDLFILIFININHD